MAVAFRVCGQSSNSLLLEMGITVKGGVFGWVKELRPKFPKGSLN